MGGGGVVKNKEEVAGQGMVPGPFVTSQRDTPPTTPNFFHALWKVK